MASNLLPIWAATGTKVAPDATKISIGWLLGEKPPYEYMNWWQDQVTDRVNHILANGIPEWEATKTYAVDVFVKRAGIQYRSLASNTNSAPPSANWLAVSQNGAALTSGVIPSARLTGAYTNFTNISGSGSATFSTFIATSAAGFRGVAVDGPTGPSFTWTGDQDTGMSHPLADTIVLGTAGVERLRISAAGAVTVAGELTAGTLTGNGSGLTALNASALSSGTIPNARLTGAYDGVSAFTVTDRITVPSGGVATVPRYGFANEGSGAGMHFLVGSLSLLLRNADGSAALTLAAGKVAVTGILNGNGSELTNLDAGALTAGVVPNARVNGSYSNFTNITGSGIATFGSFISTVGGFYAPSGDSVSAPGHSWAGDSDTGAFRVSANVYGIATGGIERLRVSSSGLSVSGTVSAGSFDGPGGNLTDLSATQLTSGTLPNARLSGDYSFANLTLSGNVGAGDANISRLRTGLGSVTDLPWAFFNDDNTGVYRQAPDTFSIVAGGSARLAIGNNIVAQNGAAFSGPGTGLSDVPAASLIGAGSLPTSVLATSTAARDWVLERTSELTLGAIGTYAFLGLNAGQSIAHGSTYAGSGLHYASVFQGGGAADVQGIASTTAKPAGTWRALGRCTGDENNPNFASTLFVRIS